jgi:hypothetical protein
MSSFRSGAGLRKWRIRPSTIAYLIGGIRSPRMHVRVVFEDVCPAASLPNSVAF